MQNIKQITIHALENGKHLVVLGAVHGNEKCGAAAIEQAIAKFEAGQWELQSGKVTFVPIANPLAYQQNKRFVERNLNRSFYPKPLKIDYEDKIDPILCKILDEADALLDIHSYQSQGGDFGFLGITSQSEIDYCRAIASPLYVYGWAEAFGNNNATKEQRLASLGTTDYVRANKLRGLAVTLECGNHENPSNAEVGLRGINNALVHLGLMQGELQNKDAIEKQIAIKMTDVYYKTQAGKMMRDWQHGDLLKKGELIAQYDDGQQIFAPNDGYIILPKINTDSVVGAEWFYFGVATDFPNINQHY